jgi:hypothetical protein
MWLSGLKELFPIIVRECTEREVFGQVSKSATGKQVNSFSPFHLFFVFQAPFFFRFNYVDCWWNK